MVRSSEESARQLSRTSATVKSVTSSSGSAAAEVGSHGTAREPPAERDGERSGARRSGGGKGASRRKHDAEASHAPRGSWGREEEGRVGAEDERKEAGDGGRDVTAGQRGKTKGRALGVVPLTAPLTRLTQIRLVEQKGEKALEDAEMALEGADGCRAELELELASEEGAAAGKEHRGCNVVEHSEGEEGGEEAPDEHRTEKRKEEQEQKKNRKETATEHERKRVRCGEPDARRDCRLERSADWSEDPLAAGEKTRPKTGKKRGTETHAHLVDNASEQRRKEKQRELAKRMAEHAGALPRDTRSLRST
ncbi:hypothetical protein TGFOU_402600 [Toxoplasma gondii FOU]|uniref:Uncharacterized protein n=1 Tax=Toxoplasma gondii FOU TaxID=943167 RepID=A0A086LHC7_TOXGO|nr:hypothetical protein TGFOU_402600 [Toxoplasma gondii FOU]